MIGENIQIILLVTGLLTAGAFAQYAYPRQVMRLVTGATPESPGDLLVARHWGLLVGLTGVFLIVAAFRPIYYLPAMGLAAASKTGFTGLVLRGRLRTRPLALAIALADAVMVVLYVGYAVGL